MFYVQFVADLQKAVDALTASFCKKVFAVTSSPARKSSVMQAWLQQN